MTHGCCKWRWDSHSAISARQLLIRFFLVLLANTLSFLVLLALFFPRRVDVDIFAYAVTKLTAADQVYTAQNPV